MDVQHKGDGGILLQIAVDGGQGPVVGPAVLGVVVEGSVVENGEARLLQGGGNLVTHPDHVVIAVGGAALAAGHILLSRRHGVGLAAVGMYNENLGALLLRQTGGKGAVKEGGIEGVHRCVADIYISRHHITLRGGGHQRPGGNAVVGKYQRGLRLLRRLRNGDVFLLLNVGGVLRLLIAAKIQNFCLSCQQGGTLADGQGHRGREQLLLPAVPQLAAENAQSQVSLLTQGTEGRLPRVTGSSHRCQPGYRDGQRQSSKLPPPLGPGPALNGHMSSSFP